MSINHSSIDTIMCLDVIDVSIEGLLIIVVLIREILLSLQGREQKVCCHLGNISLFLEIIV